MAMVEQSVFSLVNQDIIRSNQRRKQIYRTFCPKKCLIRCPIILVRELQFIANYITKDKHASVEGLIEEELEIFDLLVKGRKLTKDEEQKVKLAAKNLYKKLTEEKKNLFLVDWYKDEQASATVKDAIISSLDSDLPQSFDKEAFDSKINLLLNLFVDMSVQHYGLLGDVA